MILAVYYEQNHLRPNTHKTQVCAYHLRNREAKKKLIIQWQGVRVYHLDNPKYLGVNWTMPSHIKYIANTLGKKLQQEIIYYKN